MAVELPVHLFIQQISFLSLLCAFARNIAIVNCQTRLI